jgi:hypothetical protein
MARRMSRDRAINISFSNTTGCECFFPAILSFAATTFTAASGRSREMAL